MKGTIVIALNNDDSLTVQSTVPIDAETAKQYHYGYDWEDLAAALAKAGEQLALIKDRYQEPKVKSNITTLGG